MVFVNVTVHYGSKYRNVKQNNDCNLKVEMNVWNAIINRLGLSSDLSSKLKKICSLDMGEVGQTRI
jgi:hypothetical protein